MKTYSAGPGQDEVYEVACSLCNSKSYSLFLKGEGFRFVKCRQCGLVYQNLQPVIRDLENRYRNNYFLYEIKNEKNFFNLMKLGLKDINFDRLTSGFARGSHFLDIGCATGMLLEYMRGKGWDVRGIEICRESAEYAKNERKLSIFIGTLKEAAFPDSSFSVIHLSHLIEHVPNPKEFMAEVRRILAPRGFAIITTPNIAGLQARILKGKWRSAIPDHLTLFSKATMKRILEESGFRILKVKTWGGMAKGMAAWWIKWPMDRLAKIFGFGDVMLHLVCSNSASTLKGVRHF